MADNIPEGISFAELQQFLEDAPVEETKDIQTTESDISFAELCDLCAEAKAELFRKAKTPLAMKMIVLMILSDMEDWHRRMGFETFEAEDNIKCLIAWSEDAGRIAALRETLLDIEIMPEDPTPRWKHD